MEQYLSSASLKAMAKGQLLGKYGTVVGVYLLHFLCIYPITFIVSFLTNSQSLVLLIISSVLAFLIDLFSGFFLAGESLIFLKIACNQPVFVSDLFSCFREGSTKVLSLQFVLAGISFLSMLPATIISASIDISTANASSFLLFAILLVAGIAVSVIASLLFSQVFYLMLDYPDYTPSQLLKTSISLMKGNMGRLFYITLSFVPLSLLGVLSCGIALLWLMPYIQATKTNFYLDLVKKSKPSGLL